MTTLREIAVGAWLDQADATNRHAAATWIRLAELVEDPRYTLAGPITYGVQRKMFAAMIDRVLAGDSPLCEHLSLTAPAIAFWAAWKPGKPRCAPCAGRVGDRIRGTVENRCRRFAPCMAGELA